METTKPIKDCAQCKHGHVLTREGKPLGHCDLERVVHLSEQEKKIVEELSIIGKRKELK